MHNIQARDVQVGVEMAWHKLTKVEEKIDRSNCRILYPMAMHPLYYQDTDGNFREANGRQIISLDDGGAEGGEGGALQIAGGGDGVECVARRLGAAAEVHRSRGRGDAPHADMAAAAALVVYKKNAIPGVTGANGKQLLKMGPGKVMRLEPGEEVQHVAQLLVGHPTHIRWSREPLEEALEPPEDRRGCLGG